MAPWWVELAVAAELHVPRDYTTLQAAADAARSGDEIVVADGALWDGLTRVRTTLTVRCSGGSVQLGGTVMGTGTATLTIRDCNIVGAGARPVIEHEGSGQLVLRDLQLASVLVRASGGLHVEHVGWQNPSARGLSESVVLVRSTGSSLYARDLRIAGALTTGAIVEYLPAWPHPDVQLVVEESTARTMLLAPSSQATVTASGFVCNVVRDGLLVGPLVGGQFLAWGNSSGGRPLLAAEYVALVNATIGHDSEQLIVASKGGLIVNTAIAAPGEVVVAGVPTLEHVRSLRPIRYQGVTTAVDVQVSDFSFWGTEAPERCEDLTAMPRAGSPLIDVGRSDILDHDGSRSDIGVTGGITPFFWSPDQDRDGVPAAFDCDDEDNSRSPLLTEVPYNGLDDDCDGADDVDLDADGDPATAAGGGDCDDTSPARSTLNPEIPYDGVDNDCDGSDASDLDGDGYDGIAAAGGTDCDDRNPDVHPGLLEDVSSIDRNCDGVRDPTTNLIPAGCNSAAPDRGLSSWIALLIGMFGSRTRSRPYN